jgi:hypothetical protein
MLQQQMMDPPSTKKSKKHQGQVPTVVVDADRKRTLFLEMTMLGLDRTMKLSTTQNNTASMKPRTKLPIIGNSRGSSSGMMQSRQPTFRKKQHALENKKRMIAEIAKKLKQQGKKPLKKVKK